MGGSECDKDISIKQVQNNCGGASLVLSFVFVHLEWRVGDWCGTVR